MTDSNTIRGQAPGHLQAFPNSEEKQMTSGEIYRVIVENSLAGISIAQKGRLVFVNSRLAQILDRTREEILGHTLWEFVHADYQEMVRRRAEGRERGEDQPDHYEFPVVRKDSSIRWLEARASRIEFAGKPAVLANVIDITERKAAETALRMSEEKYRLLAENTTDVIFVQNMSLRVTYVSPSVERLSGYSTDEVLELRMEDFLTPDSFRRAIESFQREFARAQEDRSVTHQPLMEYEYIKKDGSTFWGEMKIKFLRDEFGNLTGMQGVLRDITERKQVEEALTERKKELTQQTRSLEEANTALKVLLERREEEKREIGQKLQSGLQKLVYPYVEKIERIAEGEMVTYLQILRSNLEEVTFPFKGALSSSYTEFTPSEIEVAELIRHGRTNKDIADMLKISPDGVAFHRKNIRKKLGLVNSKVNLRTYLMSLTHR